LPGPVPAGSTFEILTALGNYMLMGFEAFGVLLAPEVLIGIEAAAAVFELATTRERPHHR
jgi:hypothetical protein